MNFTVLSKRQHKVSGLGFQCSKEIITLKGFDDILTSVNDGAFIYHNGALFIQSDSEEKIIKLSS